MTPPAPPTRALRRRRDGRVAAGVSAGLGDYFAVDPVLFRVLFATSAFFGGAGVLGYVIAWAAIPEQGTTNAPVDRFIAELRRRRVPIWVAAVVAVLVFWALAFSWWAPGPFFPVIVVVIVLVVVFGRRRNVTGERTQVAEVAGEAATAASESPEWVASTRSWIAEAKQASRERRRRAFPVRIGVLVALAATLIALGIVDAVTGVRLPVYFWVTAGIVTLGLLAGVVLRRTPWSMVPLLIPAVAGMIAFGNSPASLHDGVGQTDWTPTTAGALQSDYRLAFGQGTLDLRNLPTASVPRMVHVTMAAGRMHVLLPSTLDATVHAHVRIGVIDVDGAQVADSHDDSVHRTGGYDIEHTVPAPAGASGAPITIVVHLADGSVKIDHH